MDEKITILEVKYGNIYGGMPNFFAIADIALMTFEPHSNKIFVETWQNPADVDYISVVSEVNELGHTVGRRKEVVNMRTGRVRPFQEDFRLDDRAEKYSFKQLRPFQNQIKSFMMKNLIKYRVKDLITFDGRRDIFLLERTGVPFGPANIVDLQKDLNKETDYLFSLNKLAIIANFRQEGAYLRSNNLEYWLHPIAGKQIFPLAAAYDAARLLMIHNEYRYHRADFLVRAQKLLNRIQEEKGAPTETE